MSDKEIFIAGAGGMGRQMVGLARDAGFNPIGFLDDTEDPLKGHEGYPPVVGGIRQGPLDCPVVCAIGDNLGRRTVINILKKRGARFVSLIHPCAHISPSACFGEGAIIQDSVMIDTDVRIGDFCFLQGLAMIGHDVHAGDFFRVDSMAFVGGRAKIGNNVTIHPGAKIMPGLHICDDCTIGIGSVLITSLRRPKTVFGNPAMPLDFGEDTRKRRL